MNEEHDRLETLMERTYWGTRNPVKTSGPAEPGQPVTATEAQLDTQPMETRLRDFTLWAQKMYKYIADLTGRILYRQAYKGSSIIFGDRYGLESPDAIWEKYQNARKAGAPITTLDSLLVDYYESKFSGNPIQLQKHLLLMRIEPFVHYDVGVVIAWVIPGEEKLKKMYFGEWVLTKEDIQIVTSKAETLRAELLAYAQQRAPKPEDMPKEPAFK
jgi:hypothetical protein